MPSRLNSTTLSIANLASYHNQGVIKEYPCIHASVVPPSSNPHRLETPPPIQAAIVVLAQGIMNVNEHCLTFNVK